MITTLWFVFQLRDGDILNCCLATTERQQAVERLMEVAETNAEDDAVWYRLTKIFYSGSLSPGTTLHLAVALDPCSNCIETLDLQYVVDQFELLPQDVRDDDNDKYWVDDIVLS
jgi:hypothetical protein